MDNETKKFLFSFFLSNQDLKKKMRAKEANEHRKRQRRFKLMKKKQEKLENKHGLSARMKRTIEIQYHI